MEELENSGATVDDKAKSKKPASLVNENADSTASDGKATMAAGAMKDKISGGKQKSKIVDPSNSSDDGKDKKPAKPVKSGIKKAAKKSIVPTIITAKPAPVPAPVPIPIPAPAVQPSTIIKTKAPPKPEK